jgi:hypothetical protein
MAAPSPPLFSDGLTTMLRSARQSLDRAPDLAAAGCTATRPKQLALGPRCGRKCGFRPSRRARLGVVSRGRRWGRVTQRRFESGGVAGFGGNGGRWRGRFGKSGVLLALL